ncbi:MAG: iron-containing redox enzyme family protein [Colwellia sp.]|jgi:hypothetical protein|uniref:iron-containing redox enzyme family protein n=1 Tax=Colwellia sp. Bg11-12 TaxID=2759817 RepID=UPI0015F38FFE|nr:iron-containing redox enzyme family protein [Colwellia sp. Bg11-12]MBA6262520.1 iron-containing redox enzyme family protein [Colwellia sp. Bg11-12]
MTEKLTHYQRIQESIKFISLKAFHANNDFRNHPQFSDICINFIHMNHSVARATIPMMEEVIRCAEALPNDPLSAPLIAYMKQHIVEEKDHDEWYVRDLGILGMSREEVFSRIPSPNIAAMIGSQYYWIKHHHPIAFLGYMGSLETYPLKEEHVNGMIKDSGMPAAGFDTVMLHAKIDIHHSKDIINLINTLPLTEEHMRIIEMSAFQTFRYIALMMEDICKSAPKPLATAF